MRSAGGPQLPLALLVGAAGAGLLGPAWVTCWVAGLGMAWLLLPRRPELLLAALGAALVGQALMAGERSRLDEPLESVVEGRIDRVLDADGARPRLDLAVTRCLPDCRLRRVRLSLYQPLPVVGGELWRLPVRLRPPRSFANPGRGAPELRSWRMRLDALGYVADPGAARRLAAAPGPDPLTVLREHLVGVLDRTAGSGASLLRALLLGDRSGLSPEDWTRFAATGTTHLFVVSGLHVGLFAGLVILLLRLGGRAPDGWAFVVAVLVPATGYALLTGFGLPARRALVMLALALSARALGRVGSGVAALGWALALILVAEPLAVLDAGFWLSGLAVLALLRLAGGGSGTSAGVGLAAVGQRWLEPVWIQAWVTLILSVPLVLVFGWLSASAPLVNLVAIPLISLVVLPAGLIGLATAALGSATGEALLGLLGSLLAWLIRMLDPFGVVLALASPGLPWLLCAALLLIRAAGPDPAPVRWLALVLGVALLGTPRSGPPEGEFRVRVLDVGQGSAVVVRTRNRVLVMDAGNRFGPEGVDAGALVVAPALRALGVRRIDRLLVSHGDADHAGGVPGLLAAMEVTEVRGPAAVPAAAGPCDTDLAWSWDGVRFEVLHPPAGRSLPGNRGSCVLRIRNQRAAVLLPGDVDRYVERRLAATLGRIDLVLAPHHGSRTSSGRALVRHARARWVLFSAGRPSAFDHPHPDVVARWRAAGACTAVTGDAGMLSWSSRAPERVRGRRGARPRWWRGADFSAPALARCRPAPAGVGPAAVQARAPP